MAIDRVGHGGTQATRTGRALADLPYDVWPLILAHIAHPAYRLPRDLLAVSSTCRMLRDAAEPVLFGKVTFHGPLGSPRNWADYLEFIYDRFKTTPSLLQHVTECRIFGWHAPNSDMSGLRKSTTNATEELLAIALDFMQSMPNLTVLRLRSLIVPHSAFRQIRTLPNLRTLWMLFCDLSEVDNKAYVEGGTFRALQTVALHDVWWQPDHFTVNEVLAAPRLRVINMDHSADFSSPLGSCSDPSTATNLYISAPHPLAEDTWERFFLLFPRLQLLYVDWHDDPDTLDPSPHILSNLNTLRCPFTMASGNLIRGRPLHSVWFTHRRERSPEVHVAEALAQSLGKTSAVVRRLTFTGMTYSDYASILPHFRPRLGQLQKLDLSFSDDSIAKTSFTWLTHEFRTLFPRLEHLTIGNEPLYGPDGTALVPDATHDQPLVELWGTSCPHLRIVALPGRTYDYSGHSWRRTEVPHESLVFRG